MASFSVNLNSTLTLDFDKDVNVTSRGGNIELRKSIDDSLVESYNINLLNISYNQATLSLSLSANTDYYILIDPGSLEGSNGISYSGITDKKELNFSTFSNDSIVFFASLDSFFGVSN